MCCGDLYCVQWQFDLHDESLGKTKDCHNIYAYRCTYIYVLHKTKRLSSFFLSQQKN